MVYSVNTKIEHFDKRKCDFPEKKKSSFSKTNKFIATGGISIYVYKCRLAFYSQMFKRF